MKKLDDIAIVLSDNPRAKAYLKSMACIGALPSKALILKNNKVAKKIQAVKTSLFDNESSVVEILKGYSIDFISCDSSTINDDKVIAELKNFKQSFVIFAGNPGNILSSKCFSINKKFIHIHPGKLPEQRGSTVFYYSILDDNSVSMSAIFMDPKIDAGEIIDQITFNLSEEGFDLADKTNFDNVVEPYMRSILLKNIIKKYIDDGFFNSTPQDAHSGDFDYYIIHPLLRHLAILKN